MSLVVAQVAKTEVVKARVTEAQARWLQELAEREYEGNVSLALRGVLRDARLLELARDDFARLQAEGLQIPRGAPAELTVLEAVLSRRLPGGAAVEWHEPEQFA